MNLRGRIGKLEKRQPLAPLHNGDKRECIDVLGVADGTQPPPAWWTREEAQETVRILRAAGALE